MIGEKLKPSCENWQIPKDTELLSSSRDIIPTPLRVDYPTAPLKESFDWFSFVREVRETTGLPNDKVIFLFAFRSRKKPGIDENELLESDSRAFEEVASSPALLNYFSGRSDSEGNCLSFCLWTDYDSARQASAGPNHRAVMQQTAAYYSLHLPERHWLQERPDGTGIEFFDQEPLEIQTTV